MSAERSLNSFTIGNYPELTSQVTGSETDGYPSQSEVPFAGFENEMREGLHAPAAEALEDTSEKTPHDEFFEQIIAKFGLTKLDADIVAVMHMFPDAFPFSRAMRKIADVHTIIPKPNSKMEDVVGSLEEAGYPIRHVERQNIHTITPLITRNTVGMDIGGYFVDIADRFCGIVEDTENGHQKHIAALDNGAEYPYLSAARSPLKRYEDKIVGENIADTTEEVLADLDISIQGMKVGVIGYGKIGRSFAARMKKKEADVDVSEIDEKRGRQARKAKFETTDSDTILAQSDLICVANGNKSIASEQFTQVKDGAWIVSVTSHDDALDRTWLDSPASGYIKAQHPESEYITGYINPDTGHYFYLLADGNPINLVRQRPVGDHILLVHGELLVAAHRLLTGQYERGNYELDPETRKGIKETWKEVFGEEALGELDEDEDEEEFAA